MRGFAISLVLLPCLAHAQLVRLDRVAPSIRVELGYATTSNFTKTAIYPPSARCYVRTDVAERLARVQATLATRSLGLKLWDCYRPPHAQQELWDVRPDPRYVADPKNGSRHARGAAVDVTLVDREGRELPMPTAWDDASERAHRSFAALPPDVLAHRAWLEDAMKAEGFLGLPTEWWHFDAGDWRRDAPLDWDFAELVLPDRKQLVVVVADGWESRTATLQRVQDGRPIGAAWPVALSHGLGWGIGVHAPSLSRLGGPTKREGDRRSPAGVFALTEMTGYSATAPTGARLPYRRATPSLYCVDDPNSAEYNRLAVAPVGPACASAEPMLRKDVLYTRTIFVAHNPARLPDAGSCIFLHAWSAPGTPNIGCTSMAVDRLEALASWLEPGALLVQLPREIYDQLAPAWGLPIGLRPSRAGR